MSRQTISPLASMLRKLERWGDFDADDHHALLSLPHTLQTVEANRTIVRDGARVTHTCLVRSGFVYRDKIVADGGRQILSLQIPGELVDLENSILNVADHGVRAVTRCELALIPVAAILELASDRPKVAVAMWRSTLADGAIFREWIANVGRRDAQTRLSHLLCEIGVRLEAAAIGTRERFTIPLNQEQLADCLGLTPVHVNRTLRILEEQGLIARSIRDLTIGDWKALAAAGDFQPDYLHLGQSVEAEAAPRYPFIVPG